MPSENARPLPPATTSGVAAGWLVAPAPFAPELPAPTPTGGFSRPKVSIQTSGTYGLCLGGGRRRGDKQPPPWLLARRRHSEACPARSGLRFFLTHGGLPSNAVLGHVVDAWQVAWVTPPSSSSSCRLAQTETAPDRFCDDRCLTPSINHFASPSLSPRKSCLARPLMIQYSTSPLPPNKPVLHSFPPVLPSRLSPLAQRLAEHARTSLREQQGDRLSVVRLQTRSTWSASRRE